MRLQQSPTRKSACSLSVEYFALSAFVSDGSASALSAVFANSRNCWMPRTICAEPALSAAFTASSVSFVSAPATMSKPSFWYICASAILACSFMIPLFSTSTYFFMAAIASARSSSLEWQ